MKKGIKVHFGITLLRNPCEGSKWLMGPRPYIPFRSIQKKVPEHFLLVLANNVSTYQSVGLFGIDFATRSCSITNQKLKNEGRMGVLGFLNFTFISHFHNHRQKYVFVVYCECDRHK